MDFPACRVAGFLFNSKYIFFPYILILNLIILIDLSSDQNKAQPEYHLQTHTVHCSTHTFTIYYIRIVQYFYLIHQSFQLPFSTLPSKHHADCSGALVTRHCNVRTDSQKSQMYTKKKYVPPTAARYIKTAPIITGKTASPLVLRACP